jgi:endonuclease YncB( thermonuclease family)
MQPPYAGRAWFRPESAPRDNHCAARKDILRITVLALALICALHPAQAASSSCGGKADIPGGFVRSVIDGRSIELADGRVVHLAGIEVPADDAQQVMSDAASKAALEALVLGKTVTLKSAADETDRYGRLLAYVFAAAEPAAASAQAQLVASGHALVGAPVGERACAAGLRALEHAARTGRRGLWDDPAYALGAADNPAEILGRRGDFAVVEGKVLSVNDRGGIIYLNFGRRWSEDFTVAILRRNAKAFASAGLEPRGLAGRILRVRGWVEERGGPWIEAVWPDQIEIADRR